MNTCSLSNHEWLSLVVFPRLVKYPTNISVLSFQDASSANPKLSVALFREGLISGTTSQLQTSLSSTITLGSAPAPFWLSHDIFTRPSPSGRTSTILSLLHFGSRMHAHNLWIASWSDQYHVASSLGTRSQKPCPRN